MSTVNIKVEKLPESYPGPLKVGDVATVAEKGIPELMRSGVVFSITDEAATVPSGATDDPVINGRSSVPLTILDQSIPKVAKAIEGLDVDTLKALRAAETGGKTRKGVIEALDAAIAAATA